MNIKSTRTDVNQSSAHAGRVSGAASGAAGSIEKRPASSDDTVTFTNAAEDMRKLEETLASLPDVDNNRVSQIKAAIADGSYEIDPEKIVNNLLNSERELL